MICACCGRKGRMLESFENIKLNETQVSICGDCSSLVYHLRDASKGQDPQSFALLRDKMLQRQRMGNSNPDFLKWYQAQLSNWSEALQHNKD